MKYYKRLNKYKASNVEFDVKSNTATSYGWWEFFKTINGYNVFNWYGYSNSTRKHQHKVFRLLRELGIPIHITIDAPRGLQDLNISIKYYQNEIVKLNEQINKPLSRKEKNLERKRIVSEYFSKIKTIKELLMNNADFSVEMPKYTGFIEALTKVKA